MKQRRITAALLCAILLLSQCNFKIQAASPVTQRQVEAQLAALTEQYEGVAYTDNFNGATQCKGFADTTRGAGYQSCLSFEKFHCGLGLMVIHN